MMDSIYLTYPSSCEDWTEKSKPCDVIGDPQDVFFYPTLTLMMDSYILIHQTREKGEINNIFESKIMIIFLSITYNMCFGCSKEPSH